MVPKLRVVAAAAAIGVVCLGARGALASAASDGVVAINDPSSSIRKLASQLVALSSSELASVSSVQGSDLAEAVRVAASVGAGAVLGIAAYVLALASGPLLVTLPREGSGSLRVAAARCASAVVESAATTATSALVSF